MNRRLKYILIALLVIFGSMQLIGPEKPITSSDNQGDLLVASEISSEISGILRTACYDCHSMETNYPWYGSIAPVSWILYGHINHGREELNFSTWTSMDKRSKLRALKDIQEVIEESEMPLSSYVSMHGDAHLTEDQKTAIITWAKEFARVVIKE
ncbi:MAG: heme-binding domain-containing protein [Bacteroidota bacterium]